MHEILDNSLDLVYRVNLKTRRYDYLSPCFAEFTGFSVEEGLAMDLKSILERIHPDDRPRHREQFKDLLSNPASHGTNRFSEYRFLRKDLVYRWLTDYASVVWDETGAPVAIVGVVRDTTERRRTEETLRAASRMEATATLAGGIAHDFNNLMVGVLGNAELLRMEYGHDLAALDMLNDIISAAERAGELAQQMLAFARGGKYNAQQMNLLTVTKKVLALQEGSIPSRVSVVEDFDSTLWDVWADPDQMAQVVTNLLTNAVEAISEQGTITVGLHDVMLDALFAMTHPGLEAGPYVCCSVQDTGAGMPSETLKRVFEPFFTTKFQGRGLGLAAVYGIVKNHKGHISVQSEVGHGSTFRVYLPASHAGSRTVADAPERSPQGTETILVIDDEAVVTSTTKKLLERLGYTVLLARNADEALQQVGEFEGEIHVALLDIRLPGMDGPELFPLLQQARPKMKIVLCSGYNLDETARYLLEAGASSFVQKPFRMNELGPAIQHALRAPN